MLQKLFCIQRGFIQPFENLYSFLTFHFLFARSSYIFCHNVVKKLSANLIVFEGYTKFIACDWEKLSSSLKITSLIFQNLMNFGIKLLKSFCSVQIFQSDKEAKLSHFASQFFNQFCGGFCGSAGGQ